MPPNGLHVHCQLFSIALQICFRLFSVPQEVFTSCNPHGVMGRRSEGRRESSGVSPLSPLSGPSRLSHTSCVATPPPAWLLYLTYRTRVIIASHFCGFQALQHSLWVSRTLPTFHKFGPFTNSPLVCIELFSLGPCLTHIYSLISCSNQHCEVDVLDIPILQRGRLKLKEVKTGPWVTQLEVTKLGFEPRLSDTLGPRLIITRLFCL